MSPAAWFMSTTERCGAEKQACSGITFGFAGRKRPFAVKVQGSFCVSIQPREIFPAECHAKTFCRVMTCGQKRIAHLYARWDYNFAHAISKEDCHYHRR